MLRLAVAMMALLLVVGWTVWRWTPATFTIRNESGQPIRYLTVDVGGESFGFEDIPAGGEVSGSFHVEQEEVLDVRGRLADGTEFGEWCGYVVWEEFAPHVNFVVRGEGWVGRP